MGLDDCGLLVRGSFLLGFAQLFYEAHWAALEATVKLATGACMDELRGAIGCVEVVR